jgi:hypothetical protein
MLLKLNCDNIHLGLLNIHIIETCDKYVSGGLFTAFVTSSHTATFLPWLQQWTCPECVSFLHDFVFNKTVVSFDSVIKNGAD